MPQLDERGIRLIAISPQRPDGSLTMQQKHNLSFTVVSDPGNALARMIGILSPESSEAVRAAAASLGVDVPAANADGTDMVPVHA